MPYISGHENLRTHVGYKYTYGVRIKYFSKSTVTTFSGVKFGGDS